MLWIIVSDRTVDSCGCGQWYTGRAGGQQLPGGRELPWRQVRLHSTAAACPVPCHTTQGALYNTQHTALSAAQHCTPVAHWLIFCTLHTMGSPNRDNSQPFWLKVFSEKGSRGPEMLHKTHFCTIGFSWEINSTQLLQSCKVQAKTFLLSNTTTIQWHNKPRQHQLRSSPYLPFLWFDDIGATLDNGHDFQLDSIRWEQVSKIWRQCSLPPYHGTGLTSCKESIFLQR